MVPKACSWPGETGRAETGTHEPRGTNGSLVPQAHIYSLGATLKAALEYVAEPELEPRLSRDLEALLDQMQAEDPGDRPDLEVTHRLSPHFTQRPSPNTLRAARCLGATRTHTRKRTHAACTHMLHTHGAFLSPYPAHTWAPPWDLVALHVV